MPPSCRLHFSNFFGAFYDQNKDVVLNPGRIPGRKQCDNVNIGFHKTFRIEGFLDRFDACRSHKNDMESFIHEILIQWFLWHPTARFWLIWYSDNSNKYKKGCTAHSVTQKFQLSSICPWVTSLFYSYSNARKVRDLRRERKTRRKQVLTKHITDDNVFHIRDIDAEFHFEALSAEELGKLQKMSDGNMFSDKKKEERRIGYGCDAYNRRFIQNVRRLNPNGGTSCRHQRYEEFRSIMLPVNVKKWRQQFLNLQKLCDQLMERKGLVSLRALWGHSLTAECSVMGWKKRTYRGCGNCDGCRQRFCQVTNLIKSSCGVRDAICVPHWGAVYKDRVFGNFGLKEFAAMSLPEYAAMARTSTKQFQNAHYVLPLFRSIEERKGRLPSSSAELMQFYGFDLKSAALILHQVYGNHKYGVAIDRHMGRGAINLGWVHPDTTDPLEMALMIQTWLKPMYHGRVNNVVAGLLQLLDEKENVDKVVDEAEKMGFLDLLNQLRYSPKK
jgi:hypothetical protein